jgi:methionine-rich copper-binding protein CopC
MMYCKWPIVNLCRKNGDGNYEFNFNKISLDGHEMFGVSSI